jgi:hypothetical protein
MSLLFREETTQIFLAYLAGIIDGEGSIGIECMAPCKKKDGTWIRKHNYYTPRLTVINTNEHLMMALMRNLGGTYNKRKKTEGRKICYRWHTFGSNLEIVLKNLMPYLFLKGEQAYLVLKFRETVGKTGWYVSEDLLKERHDLYLKCKKLNKVGA